MREMMRRPSWLADRSTTAGPLEPPLHAPYGWSGRTILRVAVEPIRSADGREIPDALRERLLERVRVELGLD